MTGNETPGQMLEQARRLDPAATKYLRASRRKAASKGNVDWAWWLSFQQKITCVERFLFEGRCGRQQGLRIRMPRIEEQIVVVRNLYHLAEIHHCDTGTDLLHHGKTVLTDNVRHAAFFLKPREQADQRALPSLPTQRC